MDDLVYQLSPVASSEHDLDDPLVETSTEEQKELVQGTEDQSSPASQGSSPIASESVPHDHPSIEFTGTEFPKSVDKELSTNIAEKQASPRFDTLVRLLYFLSEYSCAQKCLASSSVGMTS